MRARFVFTAVLLLASALVAQTFRGTILGTVTDASGAMISSARVTVRNVSTGLERATITGRTAVTRLLNCRLGRTL